MLITGTLLAIKYGLDGKKKRKKIYYNEATNNVDSDLRPFGYKSYMKFQI